MFWKKITGAAGWLMSSGAVLFHSVDPSALSGKGAAVYAILGATLALFGVHPLTQDQPKQ